MIRRVSLFGSLVFAMGAWAANGGAQVSSEYFHQADVGIFEFTPGIGMAAGNAGLLGDGPSGLGFGKMSARNGVDIDVTSVPVVFAFEYGLTPEYSVGGALAYNSIELKASNCPAGATCSSTKLKGFMDPVLYVNGRMGAGPGEFKYGAAASLSLEKGKIDSSGDRNMASGRAFVLTPYLAYQMAAGEGVWGARFKYEIYTADAKFTDESIKPNDRITTKGGGDWSLETFYEVPMGMVSFGGALSYVVSPETKTSLNGGPFTSNDNKSSTFMIRAYAPIQTDGATILPSVAYQSASFDSSTSSLSKMSMVIVGVAARFAF